MNIEKSFNLFYIYYHHFLPGIAVVFIVGCSEPLPPVPKTTLATPIASSTTPEPVLSQPADKPKQKLQDVVIVRKLDSGKVQRGKIVYYRVDDINGPLNSGKLPMLRGERLAKLP